MKKYFISLNLILAFLTLTVTPILADQPIVVKLGKHDEREVKNFNGIVAGGPIQVVVTLGSTESLRFEGDADAIATLVTEVKGSILVIRPQTSWTSWSHKYENKKITAYVSAKAIKSLTMSGNGSISVTGKIKAPTLMATVSGSGHITASADVDSFNGAISGSGNLNISGTADNASIGVSGSGSFTKRGFSVASLSSAISGSGSVYVNVENNIDAVISGSGSINYSGNPKVQNKRILGSGRIRKI